MGTSHGESDGNSLFLWLNQARVNTDLLHLLYHVRRSWMRLDWIWYTRKNIAHAVMSYTFKFIFIFRDENSLLTFNLKFEKASTQNFNDEVAICGIFFYYVQYFSAWKCYSTKFAFLFSDVNYIFFSCGPYITLEYLNLLDSHREFILLVVSTAFA